MDSSSAQDGGPAFPLGPHRLEDGLEPLPQHGMTLRDWFAGQALNGICAGLCSVPEENGDARGGANHRLNFSTAANDAYTLADAMLAERAKSADS